MILLQNADFVGLYRVDGNPALAQDFDALCTQIEKEILDYMFGKYLSDFIEANTLSNFAQEVRNSRPFLSEHYYKVARDLVLDYFYYAGLRGAVNDSDVYTRVGAVNGVARLSLFRKYIWTMKMRWEQAFVTNASGDIVVQEQPYLYAPTGPLYPFHFDLNFEFIDDLGNVYVVSAVTPSATAYTYSFTPVPAPNITLRLSDAFMIRPAGVTATYL